MDDIEGTSVERSKGPGFLPLKICFERERGEHEREMQIEERELIN